MKESFGTTVMLEIFMVFFVIYIALMAVVINYAITFRNKNQVISILEKNEGYNSYSSNELASFFADKNIKNGCALVNDIDNNYHGNRCEIKRVTNSSGEYYQVVVFVQFNVPLLNRTINFPVNGNTKNIYYGVEDIEKAPVFEE